MSIFVQCPHATIVASNREWEKRNRYVRKGEKGILITVPIRRKGNIKDTGEIIGHRPAYVFDIT